MSDCSVLYRGRFPRVGDDGQVTVFLEVNTTDVAQQAFVLAGVVPVAGTWRRRYSYSLCYTTLHYNYITLYYIYLYYIILEGHGAVLSRTELNLVVQQRLYPVYSLVVQQRLYPVYSLVV